MSRIKNICKIVITLASLLSSSSFAAISPKVSLVGRVANYDEKSVGIKSGNRVYTIAKSRLKFPSYKIGQEIKIPMTWKELTEFKSELAKLK
ncbi:MAG: hypothetical protein H6625_03070 [Bdellovibrionaceae bacterium]|nr:hypothetical protein [Pseudobdellovibrionaceae bacterium]